MRSLVLKYGKKEDIVRGQYAQAEERGEVGRRSNKNRLSSEKYAHALWRDGMKNTKKKSGWL